MVLPVLVVGAGPTGLTLACELRRRGVECRIVERSPNRRRRIRAVDVQARSLEVFEQVGIAERVLECGSTLHGMALYERAELIARLSYAAESTYPFVVALPQSETERLLEERLGELGGVVERAVELEELVVAEGGAVARIRGDNGVETVGAHWVVGCDGADSAVRAASNIAFEPFSASYVFAMADAQLGWALPDGEVSLFLAEQGFVMIIPLPGKRARLIVDHGGAPLLDLTDFGEICSERVGSPVALHGPGKVTSYRIAGHFARELRSGPVLLAGDAAHRFNPVGGHGMNQGIQDAFCLAERLEPVVKGERDASHLDGYAEGRRQAVRTFAEAMDFEARLAVTRINIEPDKAARLRALLSDAAPLRRAVLDAAVEMFRVAS